MAFKRTMKKFRDASRLQDELKLYVEDVRMKCFSVIEDAVMTIIHEVYFNDSMDLNRYDTSTI